MVCTIFVVMEVMGFKNDSLLERVNLVSRDDDNDNKDIVVEGFQYRNLLNY